MAAPVQIFWTYTLIFSDLYGKGHTIDAHDDFLTATDAFKEAVDRAVDAAYLGDLIEIQVYQQG